MKRSLAIAALFLSMGGNALALNPAVPVSEEVQDRVDDIKVQLDSCLKNSQTTLGQQMCHEAAATMREQIEGNAGYNAPTAQGKEGGTPADSSSEQAESVPAPYITFSAGDRSSGGSLVVVR